MVTVLPTTYNHYHFRSRTEARWGVFFDMLNIPFRYEYEGFDLPDRTWYLPDFWLPVHQCWFEVKGNMPSNDERRKAQQLAVGTGYPVALFAGDVWHTTPGYLFLPQQPEQVLFPCFWAACNRCYSIGIVLDQTHGSGVGMCQCWREGSSQPGQGRQTGGSRGIAAAFQAARQARFEHQHERESYE
jgi:hypothetical protein